MEERRKDDVEMRVYMATAKDRLEAIHNDIISLNTKVSIQNGRIFKLEKWQAAVFGGCAVMGVLMTLSSILSIWIKH